MLEQKLGFNVKEVKTENAALDVIAEASKLALKVGKNFFDYIIVDLDD